jgi:hypothetical protein
VPGVAVGSGDAAIGIAHGGPCPMSDAGDTSRATGLADLCSISCDLRCELGALGRHLSRTCSPGCALGAGA